jgi:hypothetical protein
MAGKQTTGRGTPKEASKTPPKVRIKHLVEEAIEGIERRLSDEKSPPTIGDYLKVMQLQKEIEDEVPKEIRVTWVEPETAPKSETEK